MATLKPRARRNTTASRPAPQGLSAGDVQQVAPNQANKQQAPQGAFGEDLARGVQALGISGMRRNQAEQIQEQKEQEAIMKAEQKIRDKRALNARLRLTGEFREEVSSYKVNAIQDNTFGKDQFLDNFGAKIHQTVAEKLDQARSEGFNDLEILELQSELQRDMNEISGSVAQEHQAVFDAETKDRAKNDLLAFKSSSQFESAPTITNKVGLITGYIKDKFGPILDEQSEASLIRQSVLEEVEPVFNRLLDNGAINEAELLINKKSIIDAIGRDEFVRLSDALEKREQVKTKAQRDLDTKIIAFKERYKEIIGDRDLTPAETQMAISGQAPEAFTKLQGLLSILPVLKKNEIELDDDQIVEALGIPKKDVPEIRKNLDALADYTKDNPGVEVTPRLLKLFKVPMTFEQEKELIQEEGKLEGVKEGEKARAIIGKQLTDDQKERLAKVQPKQPLVSINSEESFAKEFGKVSARNAIKIIERRDQARAEMDQIDVFISAIESGNFKTGPLADFREFLSQVAIFLGADQKIINEIGDAKSADVMMSAVNNIAIERAGNMSRMTNLSIKLIQDSLPKLTRTADGNLIIARIMKRMRQREIELADIMIDLTSGNNPTLTPKGKKSYWQRADELEQNDPVLSENLIKEINQVTKSTNDRQLPEFLGDEALPPMDLIKKELQQGEDGEVFKAPTSDMQIPSGHKFIARTREFVIYQDPEGKTKKAPLWVFIPGMEGPEGGSEQSPETEKQINNPKAKEKPEVKKKTTKKKPAKELKKGKSSALNLQGLDKEALRDRQTAAQEAGDIELAERIGKLLGEK